MADGPLPEIGAEALPSDAESMDVAIRGVLGGAPCDELEGMLAARMLACHRAVMECYGQAARPLASLALALAKHRGKGGYTVTVEHVHMRG